LHEACQGSRVQATQVAGLDDSRDGQDVGAGTGVDLEPLARIIEARDLRGLYA
jgi:hypothetical protein